MKHCRLGRLAPILALAGALLCGCGRTYVTGQVTDAAGDPFPGARLVLEDTDSETEPFYRSEALSDAGGLFRLRAASGNGCLTVSATGCATMYRSGPVHKGHNRSWDFTLVKSVTVAGRVLDTKGRPLPDRTLALHPERGRASAPGAPQFTNYNEYSEHATDGEGRFRLDGVPPCRLKIVVCHREGRMLQSPVNGSMLNAADVEGRQAAEIVVHPPEDYAISGRVWDGSGRPISRVWAFVQIPHGNAWSDWTDENGAYCIEGLDGTGLSVFTVGFRSAPGADGRDLFLADVPLHATNADLRLPAP